MAPAQIAPLQTIWIMLEKEVIFPVMEDTSVGIVQPAFPGGEMEKRSILFAVGGLFGQIRLPVNRTHL